MVNNGEILWGGPLIQYDRHDWKWRWRNMTHIHSSSCCVLGWGYDGPADLTSTCSRVGNNQPVHAHFGQLLAASQLVKSHVTGQRTCSYWHCKWFLMFCTTPCGPSMSQWVDVTGIILYILVYVRLILFIFSFHTRAVGCKERKHFCIASKPRTLSKPPVYKRGIEVDRHVPYRDSTLTLLLLASFINSQLRPEDGLGWSIACVFLESGPTSKQVVGSVMISSFTWFFPGRIPGIPQALSTIFNSGLLKDHHNLTLSLARTQWPVSWSDT
jgi:hypothetical protein